MQVEGNKHELRKLEGCKLHNIAGYDSERHRPVLVHNPKNIKGKAVVSWYPNPKRRSTSLFLRSAGLWIILTL